MQTAGLIDNASGGEIHQGHIHLMHEAGIYAWKCSWPLAPNLWPAKCRCLLPVVSENRSSGVRDQAAPHHISTAQFQTQAWTFHEVWQIQHCFVMVVPPPSCIIISVPGKKHKPSEEWLLNLLVQRKDWHLSLFVVPLTFWKYHRLNL